MRLFMSCVLALFLFTGSDPGNAARVDGLYETEVPVPDKEEAERQLAFSVALRDVLIKLTGSRNPQSKPSVVQALANAATYVEQYQYRTLSLEPLSDSQLASEELLLWTRFDQSSIDRLIIESGLPMWGRTRPGVLVWLALESDNSRSLVGESESESLINVLKDSADRRGVPLAIPALDETDLTNVSVADVWAGFDEPISIASERYRPDAILVVRGYANAQGLWESRWRLLSNGSEDDWSVSDERLDLVLAQGVDRLADRLAARYATVLDTGSGDAVSLQVASVYNVSDYARLIEFLNGLDGISRVDVAGIRGDQVELLLQARGGEPLVRRMISLGRVITPVPGGEGLQYRMGR